MVTNTIVYTYKYEATNDRNSLNLIQSFLSNVHPPTREGPLTLVPASMTFWYLAVKTVGSATHTFVYMRFFEVLEEHTLFFNV